MTSFVMRTSLYESICFLPTSIGNKEERSILVTTSLG
jgi:hypothetical protein